MTTKFLLCTAVLTFVLAGGLSAQNPSGAAQDKSVSSQSTSRQETPTTAYRLSFELHEMENGRTINTRQYSLNVVPGYEPSNELKIGTRVPIEGNKGEMQYIDVGTSIWSRMMQHGDALELEVHADLTNFAVPEQSTQAIVKMPLLRQLRINSSTVAALGKPMVVGVVDDPDSKREYQLQVTVTQLH